MTNHYAVLGVPDSASDEQIKSAYRQMVRLHHPDANPDSREAAEVQIKTIIEAFGILGNAEKRARYDNTNRMDSLAQAELAHETYHARAQGEPGSLLGRVRWILGIDSHELAACLGLSDAVLLEMEGRDVVPTTPVQQRTFINLCRRAAQKLEASGQHSDAEDLRTALERKQAQRAMFG